MEGTATAASIYGLGTKEGGDGETVGILCALPVFNNVVFSD